MKSPRYRRETAEIVSILTTHGVAVEDLPRLLDVPPERFEHWRNLHKDLQNALSNPTPVQRAEAALLKRALGFQLCEESSEELVDKKSGEILEILKHRTITKDVAPDVRALLFYLQNCHPERWDGSRRMDNYQLELPEDEKDL